MNNKYLLYYDCGTTNTRAYLLDSYLDLIGTRAIKVGARNSSINGSNDELIQSMYMLMEDLCKESGIWYEDIIDIFASGMVGTKFGLCEVAHTILPVEIKEYANNIYTFFEDKRFKREIKIIPGFKTQGDDIELINNLRGEDVEAIGVLNTLDADTINKGVCIILPGSHTQVIYVKGKKVIGLLSNLTGELYEAIRKNTILAEVLSKEQSSINEIQIKKAVNNLTKYGFNRALYIAHAMNILHKGSLSEIYSYIEGVIHGGLAISVDYYINNVWEECESAVIISNELIYNIYKPIIEECKLIKNIVWRSTEKDSYAVEGIKEIIRIIRKDEK